MRKALVVGIDQYDHKSPLYGCVNDALAVKAVLERHADGTRNFAVQLLLAPTSQGVTREELKTSVRELFAHDSEVALLYYAGHGYMETTGGYLCASDSRKGEAALALGEVLTLANQSRARNKVIILDRCHSGMAGTNPIALGAAELSEELTTLTCSTAEQYATEQGGSGVFTSLLVDAMNGAAGNLLGDVTPGSVYAHIDQSLGPPVGLADLQRITEFFPGPGTEFQMDPSFEPESTAPDRENAVVFPILQKYNRVNLVVPVDAPHIWHAAMQSKRCKLTALGEHYRRLVALGRI